MTAMTTTAPSTVVDPVKKRTWRNSKYPLRLIIRACFLTYMMCGLAYFIQVMPPTDRTHQSEVYNLEYLTVLGFLGTQLTLYLSCATEFFEGLRPIKVALMGLFLVVEFMITFLYWGIYSIDFRLIAGTSEPPLVFQDVAAHLMPFLYLVFESFYSRSYGQYLSQQRIMHIIMIPLFTFGYFIWITYLFWDRPEMYPYRFLRGMNKEGRFAFTVFSSILSIFVYGLAVRAYVQFHKHKKEQEADEEGNDDDYIDSDSDEALPRWMRRS